MRIVTHLRVLMPLPYSRRLGSGKKMRRFNSHKTVVAPALDRESSSWTGLIFIVVMPLFPHLAMQATVKLSKNRRNDGQLQYSFVETSLIR